MEDTEIVELFKKRDETAIREISTKYTNLCFGIAWNILANKEDSEECVNDTWYATWRYIPPKEPKVLSAFAGRITRGFAIDKLRKKYAGKRADLHVTELTEEVAELNACTINPVEDSIEEQVLLNIINDFLKGLSAADRDIFVRRYWYMDSIRDIAVRHGKTENNVKSRLFRNRKKLYERLQNGGRRG